MSGVANQLVDRLKALPRVVLIVIVLALGVTGVVLLGGGGETRTATAYFSRAVAIYENSEVRILGVPVGKVTEVVPSGNAVRVEIEWDAEYDVPADVKAVIVTPTLTADRFVQLSPAYTSGPTLADGAEITVENTGTPIELDRIYRSLSDLTRALGPNGVNKDGTLNNVLDAGAEFFDGQGRKINTTVNNLARAMTTFGDGSGDLFATVRGLNEFTGALAANDEAVSAFMENLGAVSTQLAGEKDELFGALKNLAEVLGKVERFVKDNRALVNANVKDLATIVQILGRQQESLKAVLDVGPLALGNLVIAWDPVTSSIGSRITVGNNVATLDMLLCALVKNGGLPVADTACALFKQLLAPLRDNLRTDVSPGQAGAATLEQGSRGRPAPAGAPRASTESVPEAPADAPQRDEVRLGERSGADDLSQLLGGQS